MAQSKILLDTNSYLRLAQSIHPLLGQSFGEQKFTLYIHKEVEKELGRSSRLQSKFSWIERDEYVNNRKKRLNISKVEKEEIEKNFNFIWDYQKYSELNLSREDIYCIATALELKIPLVTDDQNMISTCKEFDVKVMKTLELMKIMLVNKFIDKLMIKQIIDYWKYENDLPANFDEDFKKLFNINH